MNDGCQTDPLLFPCWLLVFYGDVKRIHRHQGPHRLFIQYAGSVKKMNGNYFIGGGSANYALQVNYTSNDVLLRLNQQYGSYRALKY